jgi:type IV pilus assembly protein PilA
MKTTQKGFTLIELMIAVAIVGILASVALPAFNEYQTTARVAEGVTLSKGPKGLIDNAASALEANTSMTTWNDRLGGAGASSKYVRSVLFTTINEDLAICAGECGGIEVTFNELNVGTITDETNTIIYQPYKLTEVAAAGEANGTYDTYGAALADGVLSGVEWACASAEQEVSNARGFADVPAGTLPASFAPSECR